MLSTVFISWRYKVCVVCSHNLFIVMKSTSLHPVCFWDDHFNDAPPSLHVSCHQTLRKWFKTEMIWVLSPCQPDLFCPKGSRMGLAYTLVSCKHLHLQTELSLVQALGICLLCSCVPLSSLIQASAGDSTSVRPVVQVEQRCCHNSSLNHSPVEIYWLLQASHSS